MFQELTIIGDLGRDPEMRYTPSSQAVTNFTVATSNKFKKEGEWQTETTWFRVTTWGNQAEACRKYLEKGSRVLVKGTVKYHVYTKKDGTVDASLEVNASTVKFLDKANGKKRDDEERYEYDDVDIPGFMQD